MSRFLMLCAIALLVPLASAHAQINVVAGSYGLNCRAPRGNKTSFLQQACNGKPICDYTIDYTLIGDPAVGCGKDYVAEWRCGSNPEVFRATVAPEAGFRKQVQLNCQGGYGPPPPSVPGIQVVAGSYGMNCRAEYGNKTSFLQQVCNGKPFCDYTIDYTQIGDPAVGCAKDYVAEWRCGANPEVFRAAVAPEAGFQKHVQLNCQGGVAPPPPSGGAIQIVAGSYGQNCRAPRGNKTAFLAQACNGRPRCTYTIDYTQIGDPAVGCAKDYVAEWQCAGEGVAYSAVVSPEAGFRKSVTLLCP